MKISAEDFLVSVLFSIMFSFWFCGIIGINAEYVRLFLIGIFFVATTTIFFREIRSLKFRIENLGILIITMLSFLFFPKSTVMSFFRLSSYIMLSTLVSNKVLSFNVYRIVRISVVLSIFSFGIQFLLEDYQYLNGFKRYSGLYYMHSAGFALLTQLLVFEYYLSRFLDVATRNGNAGKILIFILLLLSLFMTGSRSATIITFLGLVYLIFYRSWLRISLGILMMIGLGIYLIPILENSSYFYRLNTLLSSGLVDASSQSRLSFLTNGFGLVESEFMIFGYGVGRFDDLYQAAFGKRLAAHFYPLQWFVEGGIVYVFLWLTFYYRLLISVGHTRKVLGVLFVIVASINNGEYYFSVYILFLLIMINNGKVKENHSNWHRLRRSSNRRMSFGRGY